MRPEKKSKNVPAASGSDGIDALPDDVLEHIIGFLPVDEAGRTSVLARRWRQLWKYAMALRIRCVEDDAIYSQERGLKSQDPKDIDDMLRLRGRAPLQVCELTFACFYNHNQVARLNRWVRHVVTCQVQRFRLENFYSAEFLELDNLRPLVSRHLTRLELVGLQLNSEFCDFSSCPSLHHLELIECYFCHVNRLSSDSVKWLRITDCDYSTDFSTLILVPSLVSLRLHGHLYRPPILGNMPLLHEAFVRVPLLDNYADMVCEEENCYSCLDIMDDNKYALLNGLSNAENLALLSESTTFVFKRDLKHCPIFSKLKTLLLNDHWCVPPDFSALTCILKNSPVLEMLVLQLFSKEPDRVVEIEGRYNPMERSTVISEHLKAIKIKCEAVDENVHKILKFMCTFNICNMPLVSQNLTRLELAGVQLNTGLCDFSGCPSLEHLDIAHCDMGRTTKIYSKSLKRLAITNCTIQNGCRNIVINVPSLVSLKLATYWDTYDKDCRCSYSMECYGNTLFVVLPETENLASISGSAKISSKRYLKWCSAFSKLKTVLLDNYWCVAPDYQPITCILKNSPVLEKLILQLFSEGPKYKVELIRRCNLVERSVAISEHLKAIEVKFQEFDIGVHKILKYLCTLNIYFVFE